MPAQSVVPRCFQGVTGWGRAVKSESRTVENNDFVACQYAKPPNVLCRKKLFEMELIGRKKISPVKILIPPQFSKLKQNSLL